MRSMTGIVPEAKTETELKTYIADGGTISIGADIFLTSTVKLNGVTDLVINGNGYKIDGQNLVLCFIISSGSSVELNELIISNGNV